MREVASEEKVPLIDLYTMSIAFYENAGADAPKILADGTHSTAYGGYEFAKCIVMGINQNKLDLANSSWTTSKTLTRHIRTLPPRSIWAASLATAAAAAVQTAEQLPRELRADHPPHRPRVIRPGAAINSQERQSILRPMSL